MKKPTRVERKRHRRRVIFRLVLMLALVTLAVAYVFKSDFFNIDFINIEGEKTLSEETILVASGITIGENLLKVNTKDSKDEIELLSYVKEAEIKYKLPDSINITITERVPVLQVKTLAIYMLIDKDGQLLEIADKRTEGLPSLVGFNINDIKPGENIKDDELGIKLEDFFTEDDIIEIIKKINTINLGTDEEINIDLNSGIGVAFGYLDNVEYKLRLLDKILLDIEKKQLKCKMIIMNKGENPILVLDNE